MSVVPISAHPRFQPADEPLLTRKQLMAHYKVKSPNTILNWKKSGCPYIPTPGADRFKLSEVEVWLRTRKVTSS